jgi:hypothetical protein
VAEIYANIFHVAGAVCFIFVAAVCLNILWDWESL